MLKSLKDIVFIEDIPLKGKTVFIRVDFNVPVVDGVITDDSRIQGALPTINYVLDQGGKVVLGSHFGRPKTKDDKPKYSLETVAKRLQELTDLEVLLIEEPTSEAPVALLKTLRPHQIILLENLRFEPSEVNNSEALVQAISRYTDVYINDAFGASHRAHASIVGLPKAISTKGIGYLMRKEVKMLESIVEGAEKPYWAIIGGAKVSDKIPVIENLIDHVDGFIIGGAMAYTFLASQGHCVGNSLVEKEQINFSKQLLKRLKTRDKKILLPIDHIAARSISALEEDVVTVTSIDEGYMGLDIGPQTVALYKEAIKGAKTIFWNGPMGVFEDKLFSNGTYSIAKAIAETDCVSIVGGGDSASAARISGVGDQFTHISTGGGASLEFLQGLPLPGLLALKGAYREHMGKQ